MGILYGLCGSVVFSRDVLVVFRGLRAPPGYPLAGVVDFRSMDLYRGFCFRCLYEVFVVMSCLRCGARSVFEESYDADYGRSLLLCLSCGYRPGISAYGDSLGASDEVVLQERYGSADKIPEISVYISVRFDLLYAAYPRWKRQYSDRPVNVVLYFYVYRPLGSDAFYRYLVNINTLKPSPHNRRHYLFQSWFKRVVDLSFEHLFGLALPVKVMLLQDAMRFPDTSAWGIDRVDNVVHLLPSRGGGLSDSKATGASTYDYGVMEELSTPPVDWDGLGLSVESTYAGRR